MCNWCTKMWNCQRNVKMSQITTKESALARWSFVTLVTKNDGNPVERHWTKAATTEFWTRDCELDSCSLTSDILATDVLLGLKPHQPICTRLFGKCALNDTVPIEKESSNLCYLFQVSGNTPKPNLCSPLWDRLMAALFWSNSEHVEASPKHQSLEKAQTERLSLLCRIKRNPKTVIRYGCIKINRFFFQRPYTHFWNPSQ